jgi:hypothetical protein
VKNQERAEVVGRIEEVGDSIAGCRKANPSLPLLFHI